MRNGVSRSRTLIEWSLSALALTTIVLVMLSAGTPVREYAATAAAQVRPDAAGGVRIPEPIAQVGRTAWRICMDHQPLAGFAGVAMVLVLFMRRMR
jgi:hypothetical protein